MNRTVQDHNEVNRGSRGIAMYQFRASLSGSSGHISASAAFPVGPGSEVHRIRGRLEQLMPTS
jgi:hypothetical protein